MGGLSRNDIVPTSFRVRSMTQVYATTGTSASDAETEIMALLLTPPEEREAYVDI